MKIEVDLIREILENARDEALRPVDDTMLIKDINDKFFNFGVENMFYFALNKVFDAEKIAKEISA